MIIFALTEMVMALHDTISSISNKYVLESTIGSKLVNTMKESSAWTWKVSNLNYITENVSVLVNTWNLIVWKEEKDSL